MVSPASLGDAHWSPLLKCAPTTSDHEFPHNTALLPWLYTLYVQTGSQFMCGICMTSRASEKQEWVSQAHMLRLLFHSSYIQGLSGSRVPKICPGTSHRTQKPVKNKLPCSSISPGNIRLCWTLPLLWLLFDLHISSFSSQGKQTLMETTQGRMRSFSLTL